MALSDISTDSRVNNVDYFLHVMVRVDGKLEGPFPGYSSVGVKKSSAGVKLRHMLASPRMNS